MRKEIVLAIVLGVVLGLVIIFGINLANQSASDPVTPTPSPTQATQPPVETTTLQVSSPELNSLSFQDTLVLTGSTKENAWVSLIWEEGETIIKSDETGAFSQEIDLIGGENIIKITARNGQDYQESLELTVIYTTAEIKTSSSKTPQPTTQEEATPSADQEYKELIQRIQDKAGGKPTTDQEDTLKGYAGVITKINDFSLVINTSQNKMLQITTDEATDIVRGGKSVKATSLSIDEKIIIIGQLDTEDILSAKRIVAIKTTTPDFSRQTIIGPISNLDLETLSLTIKEFDIDIPKKSDVEIEDLQESQIVMAIIETDTEDDTHTLLALQPLLQ